MGSSTFCGFCTFRCIRTLCGFSSLCDGCRLWGAIQRTIDTGEKCLRVEAVIPTRDGRGDGETVLMVSTAPIWSIGKRMALVFLEDFTEFMKRLPAVGSND